MFLQGGAISLTLFTTITAQVCYYPNGNQVSQEPVGPCSPGSGETICCPLNWQCLSNNLCYDPAAGILGRYSCTDKSWGSACASFCTQSLGSAAGNQAVLKCSDNTFCCDGNRSFNCCSQADSEFFQLSDGSVVATITEALQSVPTTISATTPSIQATLESPTSSDNDSASNLSTSKTINTGQTRYPHVDPDVNGTLSWKGNWHGGRSQRLGLEIGLSVGAVVGVLLMLLIHLIYRCWRQHRKDQQRTIFPYSGKGDKALGQSRASCIPRWRKGKSKENTTSSDLTSQIVTSENRLSELPADDVTVVPGRLELPHEPVDTTSRRIYRDTALDHQLSPVSDPGTGSQPCNVNSQVTNIVSPVSETFQAQSYPSTNIHIGHRGPQNVQYYASLCRGNTSDVILENIGSSGEWSLVQSPTLVELPADEIIQPPPLVYRDGKATYD